MVDDTLNTTAEGEALETEQADTITRVENELKNFKKEPRERRTTHHLNARLERIRSTRDEFLQRHRKLLDLDPEKSGDYFKNDVCDLFENAYLEVIAQIQIKYDEWFSSPTQSASGTQSGSSAPSTNNVTYNLANDLSFKLPELSIPKFNGTYIEWPEFYDSFLFVHNHRQLNDGQKLQHLRNALSPKVKSLIGYLDITSNNYQTVWDALIDRYNNKRVLFSNYMEKFMSQPSIHNDSAEELQTLHDVSRACIVQFTKLGVDIDACSILFAHIIIQKLPSATRLDWEKELGKPQPFQLSTS